MHFLRTSFLPPAWWQMKLILLEDKDGYLGHIIEREELDILGNAVDAIGGLKQATNATDLKYFLSYVMCSVGSS